MPDPIRAIVVDDEPLGRASLRRLLADDHDVELVAECANGADAIRAVRDHAPELLFLDVEMPGKGGFDVVRELGDDIPPVVVFVTAYDQYALQAFDVDAVDYLLKPFDDERFQRSLDRAKGRLRPDASASGLARLSIHREGRVDVVEVERIAWIEAADQYVLLHTDEGDVLMRESMSKLEKDLDPRRFLRVHRSAIVSLDRVRRLERGGAGGARVLLGEDTWLPVSRARLATLRERLG